MKREISAGFIIFRRTKDGIKYLLLYHRGGYWNFPKGQIESEEKSLTAALRETREEAGLTPHDLRIMKNFKTYERFYFKRAGVPTFKIVIFYLAETGKRDIKISWEHNGYGWFLFHDAKKIVGKYRDTVKVLQQARDFLEKRKRDLKT